MLPVGAAEWFRSCAQLKESVSGVSWRGILVDTRISGKIQVCRSGGRWLVRPRVLSASMHELNMRAGRSMGKRMIM